VPAPTTLGSGREGLAALLALDPAPDAVFCSSDLLALGVLTEAAARALAVPERLAVVGFGDLAFAGDAFPPLTTVRIDGTGIGRLAARCIVDRAEGREVQGRVFDVGFSIVERASARAGPPGPAQVGRGSRRKRRAPVPGDGAAFCGRDRSEPLLAPRTCLRVALVALPFASSLVALPPMRRRITRGDIAHEDPCLPASACRWPPSPPPRPSPAPGPRSR
jgi:hypothetical protein